MGERFKIKLQQTTHALGVLASNQRLLIANTVDDGLLTDSIREETSFSL